MMPASRKIPIACAVISVAVCSVAVAAVLSVHGWRASALVRISNAEPMGQLARTADRGFVLVDPQAHYDGTYFYAIARDPFARGDAHTRIDRAAYRYGHPGYGWLAWIASGGGRAGAIPDALLVLGLLGVGVAGYTSSRIAREFGRSPWWGLIVAVTPGVVFAVTVDTSEPVAAAMLGLTLLAWLRGRYRAGAVAAVFLCFVKEPLLLAVAGLAVWEIVRWVSEKAEGASRRVAMLAAGPVAYGLWYVYLRGVFHVWPFQQEAHDFFSAPLAGWIDSMRRAARAAIGPFEQMQTANAAIPLLAVTAALLLFGIVRALRLTTPLDPVFILMALLALSLNWLGVLYPKDLIRETALQTLLLPAVIAGARSPLPTDRPPQALQEPAPA